MVESDSWFRLRWFLLGALAAVTTAFALEPPRPEPVEVAPVPKVFATPVATEISATESAPEVEADR